MTRDDGAFGIDRDSRWRRPDHVDRRPLGVLTYAERSPHPALQGYVRCYWRIASPFPVPAIDYRVVPDGCADIVLNLGGPVRRNGGAVAPTVLVGAMKRPAMVTLEAGVSLVGIRFRPEGVAPLLRGSAGDLADHVAGTADLGPGLASVAWIAETIAGGGDWRRSLDAALLRHVATLPPPDRVVAAAVGRVQRARGRCTVRELALGAGLSERQIERRFLAAVGLAPKLFCRVVRLQHAIALLDQRNLPGLGALAHEAGFADQPHLCREFAALTGLSPRAFAVERLGVGFVQDGG